MHTLSLTTAQLDVLDELITAERVRLSEDMSRPMHAPEYRATMDDDYKRLGETRDAVRAARDGKGGIEKVRLSDFIAASNMDDLDEAAASLQTIAGITDGGVASMCLNKDRWRQRSPRERGVMLLAWLLTERDYEEKRTS